MTAISSKLPSSFENCWEKELKERPAMEDVMR